MSSSKADSRFLPPASGQGQRPLVQASSEDDSDSLSEPSLASHDTAGRVEREQLNEFLQPGDIKYTRTDKDQRLNGNTEHEHKNDAVDTSDAESWDSIEGDGPALERLNRFSGPVNDWRRHTEAERRIARSLEIIRARDLSQHLYNVFSLKASNDKLWQPKVGWTAWPLESRFVPRSGNNFEPNDDTVHPILSSRAELEEILVATVTKYARERFFSRMRDNALSHASRDSTPAKGDGSASSSTVFSSAEINASPGDGPTDSDDDEPLKARLQSWRSKHKDDHLPSAHSQPHLAIPNTDPDLDVQLLRPSVRNLQSNLDKLLCALGRSRQNTWRAAPKRQRSKRSVSGTNSRASSTTSRVSRLSRQRSETELSEVSISGDADLDKGVLEVPNNPSSAAGASTGGGQDATMGTRRIRVNRRDWSDIIGVAAVTEAFNPAVIERARARCARIFKQNMELIDLD